VTNKLEIDWPDRAVERVRAARGRLELAAAELVDWPLAERIGALARVVEAWTAPDSVWRRELAEALGASSPFDPRTVRAGLDDALGAWRAADFAALCRRELALVLEDDEMELLPFEWTAVLAGGSIPMPTLLSTWLPLVLGSPVLLRETTHDRETADLLGRSLEAVDRRLGRAFEAIHFPHEDEPALTAFLEAPCVVATGSDETIASIRSRLAPATRFTGYGHRFSIGLLGPELASDRALLERAARGIALDVARWDQSGCLSPAVVYLLGLREPARADLAHAIHEALERITAEMPRGELSPGARTDHASERAEARMREAGGRGAQLFEGEEHTLVLEADAHPRPAPLHRFLRLMPVADAGELERALEPFRGMLSTSFIAGFPEPAEAEIRSALSGLGLSRYARPGTLQCPPIDWPHDGMPLLTPMARLVRNG